ncbi:hypothetical protein ACI78R_22525 [Geodermatophilus sp. SYSU D01106]
MTTISPTHATSTLSAAPRVPQASTLRRAVVLLGVLLSMLCTSVLTTTHSASAATGVATVRVCFYESGYVTGTQVFKGNAVRILNQYGTAFRTAAGGCATVQVWAGVSTRIEPNSLALTGGTPWYVYASGRSYDLGWVRVYRNSGF